MLSTVLFCGGTLLGCIFSLVSASWIRCSPIQTHPHSFLNFRALGRCRVQGRRLRVAAFFERVPPALLRAGADALDEQ